MFKLSADDKKEAILPMGCTLKELESKIIIADYIGNSTADGKPFVKTFA